MAPDARRAAIRSAGTPQSSSASSVCWPANDGGRWIAPGVREKRGPGAGCTTPLRSTKVPRSTLCGCFGASSIDSTGAKHASVVSSSAHHSSRVLVRKIAANVLLAVGPPACGPSGLGSSSGRHAEPVEQGGVELRLDRPDRDELAVGGLVHLVVEGAGVEQVGAALVVPDAHGAERVEHRHEQRGAVDHRAVDHLALARARGLEQRRTRCRRRASMPPPPKSPTRLSGGGGWLAGTADRLEGAGERDVVDVVAGGAARTGRPGPSRSSGRRRGAGCAPGRRRARSRGARTRRGGSPRCSTSARSTSRAATSTPSGCLRSTPTERRPRLSTSAGGLSGSPPMHDAGPVDADDVGAHVGEHHGAERARADAGDLEDLDSAAADLTDCPMLHSR